MDSSTSSSLSLLLAWVWAQSSDLQEEEASTKKEPVHYSGGLRVLRGLSRLKIGLLLIALTVTGCVTSSGNFCEIYKPVRTLEVGTELQKLTVDQNNAAYLENCKGDF